MKKVFLEDVATALEETMDGWEQFLNTETGETVFPFSQEKITTAVKNIIGPALGALLLGRYRYSV